MKNKIILLAAMLFLFVSCRPGYYSSKFYRYRIKYPSGWLLIDSKKGSRKVENFKESIKSSSPIVNYESVDVAFYNPTSEPPIYKQITISSQQKRINIANVQALMPQLEEILTLELNKIFQNVELFQSKFEDFKKGKIARFEFLFEYNNEKYLSIYIIIPGKLFATNYINGICKFSEVESFNRKFSETLNSFDKY